MSFSPRYRALVYGSLIASFLVVVWGGIVRVTGSGLGCPDWPLCHGQFLPSLDPATRIEWTHRFLAIVGGLTVASLVLGSLIVSRADRRLLVLAIAVAVHYPLQAVLGAITVVLELPPEWVTVHLANAELLLAALTILAVIVRWPKIARERAPGWTWLAVAAAAGTFVLLVSGAYVRGANATTACLNWPLCGAPASMPPELLNTTVNRFVPSIDFPTNGAAAIAMLHRYIAAGAGVVVLLACIEAWRHRRDAPGLGPLAIGTAVIFIVQVAIGAANPLSGFSPWALSAHPAVASLLWCSVIGLAAVAWRPASQRGALVRDLIALTKPAIMSLLLLTALGGMFLAAHGIPPFGILAATLIGGAAVTGSLDLSAWLLFAIVFFWTPAHFWALALLIRDDYERAGVPMLPVVRGDEATAWNILAYAASLLPLTLLLFIIGGLGYVYLAVAVILGGLFIAYAFRLLRSGVAGRRAMARAVYLYSLLYLALLFVAIMVDSTLRL